AARLGLRVALAAAVGEDPAGGFMLGQLAGEGVDTAPVAVRDQAPTGMTVALSAGGDRAILTATGAVATLTARDVPSALLSRARHVHVSSYFLAEHSLGPGLAALLGAARAGGASTSLDTNWDPAQRWGGERLARPPPHVRLLRAHAAQARPLAGEPLGPARARTPAQAGGGLGVGGRRGGGRGGEGGGVCADGTRRYLARPPPVTVTDTTGAGDCFNAGVIAGLLSGEDLPSAVALGCAVGAASTRAPGG